MKIPNETKLEATVPLANAIDSDIASIPTHYVDNLRLISAIVAYKKEVKVAKKEKRIKPRCPEYIGECFYKISNHLSFRPNFIGYSFRQDMVMDGVENCLMYFENFNEKISKYAHAYFSKIIWWAFCRRIAKEKKEQYIKYKSMQREIIHDGMLMNEDADVFGAETTAAIRSGALFDNINDFIAEFEMKKTKAKKDKLKKEKAAKAPASSWRPGMRRSKT